MTRQYGFGITLPEQYEQVIPTLVMFPILILMYVRLARREEREVQKEFSDAYAHYAAITPAFFPRALRPASRAVRNT